MCIRDSHGPTRSGIQHDQEKRMSEQDVSPVVEKDTSPGVEASTAESAAVSSSQVESAEEGTQTQDVPGPGATELMPGVKPVRPTKTSALVREGEVAADSVSYT